MVSEWDLPDLSPRATLRIPTAGSARNSMSSGTIPVSLFSIKRRARCFSGRLLAIRFFNRSAEIVQLTTTATQWSRSTSSQGAGFFHSSSSGGPRVFASVRSRLCRQRTPPGEYFLYDFVTDPDNFVDYPKTGVWPDGYYMSGHVFNASGTAFLAGRIFVFEREQMLKGFPARQLQADLKKYGNKPQYGFLPSDLDSLTPPPAGEAAFVIGPTPDHY